MTASVMLRSRITTPQVYRGVSLTGVYTHMHTHICGFWHPLGADCFPVEWFGLLCRPHKPSSPSSSLCPCPAGGGQRAACFWCCDLLQPRKDRTRQNWLRERVEKCPSTHLAVHFFDTFISWITIEASKGKQLKYWSLTLEIVPWQVRIVVKDF